MSTHKFFAAGSGGQGVLMIGQILAYSAMKENKEVTFLPSYGPEMRGGTANCTVIISDKQVSCPMIYEADIVVAMTPPSLLKYESLLKPNGTLFINTSLVDVKPSRSDIEIINIPANDIATEIGNFRSANIVMLGAINHHLNLVKHETIKDVLKQKVFAGRKASLFDINWQAYNYGY